MQIFWKKPDHLSLIHCTAYVFRTMKAMEWKAPLKPNARGISPARLLTP